NDGARDSAFTCCSDRVRINYKTKRKIDDDFTAIWNGIIFTTQLDKSSFPVRVLHAIYFCGATDSFHRERVVIAFLDGEYSHSENCEKESYTNRHITKSLL